MKWLCAELFGVGGVRLQGSVPTLPLSSLVSVARLFMALCLGILGGD